MSKLDPRLLAAVEGIGGGSENASEVVEVMVGLSAPLDDRIRADLVERGFQPRTEAGDILTGSVPLLSVARLADLPCVVTIEASGPLFREAGSGGEG